MKRKIVRRSMAAYPSALGQTSEFALSRGPGSASRYTAQPIWKSALRQAWLAALPRGDTSTLHQRIAVACMAWAAGAALSASAAILTAVPMQGTMVMPKLYYHASDGTLTISLNPKVPQLTPLLVSNPGDYFDPADPWYDCLDPTRQGLAFSRRYGFVMDGNSDVVPFGTAIWIRKLSSSPELGAYRYGNVEPKQWEPIFGTAGSTNALEWDLVMFHPCFTVPAGTQACRATFEAFLVDTATGTPLPGGSTGPFVLDWTDVPDGRPTLCAGPNVVITWPDSTITNYVLEAADSLSASSWTTVTNIPIVQNGQWVVVVEPSEARRFFRMRLGP